MHGKPVGVLEQTAAGKMLFSYDSSASQAISVGMPIRQQPYVAMQCEAFFGGFLPESEVARKIIGKQYGVSSNNSFALLGAIGYDCAGAISFHEMDAPIVAQYFYSLTGKLVTEKDLYEHIQALPKNPLFLGWEELRLSLAGVQDKAAVCIIDNQIALPDQGCPTTHILKPAVAGFEGIIENEYFCLKLAAHIGLSVPGVEIRQVKDIIYLLIERYDRNVQKDQVARIHQEDFCQALGIISARKYQNEGGPGFKQCFDLLENATQPAIDRKMLASALIFNFLIGNMDAHGKNFSLLHGNQSQLRLAPFYDMFCTQTYSHLTSKMAMKIGSKYEFDKVLPRHWEQLCIDINYAYPALKQLIKKQGEAILKAAELEREHLVQMRRDISIVDKIINLLKRHIARIFQQFEGNVE